jgi:PAS domain S-box-containing protein
MVIMKNISDRIKGLSIKWKMLILFLILAFAGTTTLSIVSLRSQQNLILNEEKSLMLEYLKDFQEDANQMAEKSIAIAVAIAEDPGTGKLLADGDRKSLITVLNPLYERLKKESKVFQINIYIPPATSFIRLPKPDQREAIPSHARMVSDSFSDGKTSSFFEKIGDNLCIMGLAPIYNDGKIMGSLAACLSLDKVFIEKYSMNKHINTALYYIEAPGDYRMIAFVGKKPAASIKETLPGNVDLASPKVLSHPEPFPNRSIIIGPLKDLSGNIAALIEFDVDRSEIMSRLAQNKNLFALIGVAGIAMSFILAYLMVSYLTKPLRELVKEALDIATGKRESRLESRPSDEIGVLTNALNSMLEALKQRRLEVEHYAKTLENRVNERTSELITSEEKYRTLVENAPLIVYRVRRDGTTEFINSKLTENTGYTVEEVLNDKRFWRDKIAGMDQTGYNTINRKCFIEGQPCRMESRVMAKDGRILTFITHAIPSKDSNGKVKWIDGIMMDITEIKRLQDSAIQNEGIRTIGEISARMAHELRNPLSAAGGFAYRLKESLKDDPANRKMAEIIFEEVAKLENFVKMLLSSIESFELTFSEVDVNSLLLSLVEGLDAFSQARNITLIKDFEPETPKLQADPERLSQSLGNILKHAIISTPPGETVFVYTSWAKDHILITLTHKVDKITANDMDKFFFPHIEPNMDKSLLDLPLSKIVIQRHGGKIDLIREKGDVLIMKIRFPLSIVNDAEGSVLPF